jgi:hypothetical protein
MYVEWCLTLKLEKDFIEVWSGCRIKSFTVAEFGEKGDR